MIVDDSLMARRMLKPILEEAGHEVVMEATGGKEAIRGYKLHSPDLVTMDITMPGTDGMSATKEILREFPEARIVMVTALRDQNKILEAAGLGALNYILKPYSKDKVFAVLKEALAETPVKTR